ncbi:unnamed protein product [Aspergillus oryzae var. brunneus]|uniref:Unnamed protein product n=2 Tax=Aspergillus oryzae TaxID=5062 RepID=A0AAN5BWZ0_ASPOZ|nr:unnamed protein product [Aspergillus oryzae]GMG51237.1 unnamed protein product [Aspergillus oryzae var. brunneus]
MWLSYTKSLSRDVAVVTAWKTIYCSTMSFCFWDLRSTSPAHGSFELAMGNQRAGPAGEVFQFTCIWIHIDTSPLPLVEGPVHENIGTQTMRLAYEPLPGSRQRQWIYYTRNAEDQLWIHNYAFTEMEFFQRDFELMSFFTSCHSDCFLTSHLLVVKYLREGDEVYGKIVLDDDKIKKNDGGKNVLLQTCMTERARVEALKDQFGIELTEEEQNGIQGRMSALATSDS